MSSPRVYRRRKLSSTPSSVHGHGHRHGRGHGHGGEEDAEGEESDNPDDTMLNTSTLPGPIQIDTNIQPKWTKRLLHLHHSEKIVGFGYSEPVRVLLAHSVVKLLTLTLICVYCYFVWSDIAVSFDHSLQTYAHTNIVAYSAFKSDLITTTADIHTPPVPSPTAAAAAAAAVATSPATSPPPPVATAAIGSGIQSSSTFAISCADHMYVCIRRAIRFSRSTYSPKERLGARIWDFLAGDDAVEKEDLMYAATSELAYSVLCSACILLLMILPTLRYAHHALYYWLCISRQWYDCILTSQRAVQYHRSGELRSCDFDHALNIQLEEHSALCSKVHSSGIAILCPFERVVDNSVSAEKIKIVVYMQNGDVLNAVVVHATRQWHNHGAHTYQLHEQQIL
jgi:hypothetical protein